MGRIHGINGFLKKPNGATASKVHTTRRHRADPALQLSSSSTMQAEKQQAWKISAQAKAKNFHFKLKATQIAPSTWKLHRLSISLKLRKLFLGVNAESTGHQKTKKNSEFTSLLVPGQQQKQTLKSKFLIFVKKFRFRSTKKRDKPQRFSYEVAHMSYIFHL